MGHQRPPPQEDPFSDSREQMSSQFYFLDGDAGEYRHYSSVSGYSALNHGRVTASVQPSMQGGLPEPVPAAAMLPVPVSGPDLPVPIALGGGDGQGGSEDRHSHDRHNQIRHGQDRQNFPPVAPPLPTTLLAAHPQLDYQHQHHHRHLPLQPHPRPHSQHQLHPPHLHSHPADRFSGRPLTMASPDEHSMAAQQDAAMGYQPTLDALPQTYVSYRPVKGDGNCGWRAIGFSYFEKLVETGDPDQVEGEAARLMSMNHFLGTVGGYDFYEDWADEAIGLLRELANCVTDAAAAHSLVHTRWTDTGTSSALIYYLRLLAATHLKSHPDQYDPFVPDGQGIRSYCAQTIELPDREIDQLGITALCNCLLKPLEFVLEIAYLDRSPGAAVNTYRFPEEANGRNPAALGPMIHLLYRPDHYDILYRRQPGPISMQVNRATSFYSHTPINSTHSSLGAFATTEFGGLLTSLPSAAPPGMSTLSSPTDTHASLPSSCDAFTLDGGWMPPLPTQRSIVQGRPHPTTESPGPRPPPPPSHTASPAPNSECNIRFTKMQLNYEVDTNRAAHLGLLPFNVVTNTFKNSIWNRAHFGNPEFHPEQWRPGDDSGADDRASGSSSRKKKGGGSAAKET
ncbi:ubiquitin thiolesterase [Cordyceps fumosorosea ARSEF 2679]|uniref:ubiquitinyl hydrolase 1 n=1 Tax=Cordyceps fumosorosea (strain ARSEF 2679) TaxID=1081104 RepID=A0A168BQ29_CORFA|nr:ubiquitin thiolesterase [Cordyceps fumosorosea ARSEF 2679]OAA70406.1 ubiquitin thiolesterase [Cordyceps fumosorosea ARSEF 2679]